MTEQTIRLYAEDLWSKWGFGDGDMLTDVSDDEIAFAPDQNKILLALVTQYLLPLLPGVQVEIWGTCHNPIRATDFEYRGVAPETARGLYADVSYGQIKAAMASLF